MMARLLDVLFEEQMVLYWLRVTSESDQNRYLTVMFRLSSILFRSCSLVPELVLLFKLNLHLSEEAASCLLLQQLLQGDLLLCHKNQMHFYTQTLLIDLLCS